MSFEAIMKNENDVSKEEMLSTGDAANLLI